jgi:hypothetical protein
MLLKICSVKLMAAPSNNLALTGMFAICPNLKKIPTFLFLSSDLYSSRIEIDVIVQSIGSSPDIDTPCVTFYSDYKKVQEETIQTPIYIQYTQNPSLVIIGH